jgi:hypothetical protein
LLVGSIKRCDVAPGLLPANQCYFEAEGRGLAQVMRVAPTCCVYFVLRKTECLAFGQISKIYIYNLESGDLICELRPKGTERITSIAVAGEGCGVKQEEVGDVGLGKLVWLAAGCRGGSVCIWDVDTERCVTTLHPMDGLQYSLFSCVSVASYRRRVVFFMELHGRNVDKGCLHVWNLKSDGTQERYEFVYGRQNSLGFELASAALLHQDNSKRCSVERCSSRAVRFERSSAEGKLSEETDSMLLMRVLEDDFVAELAESE